MIDHISRHISTCDLSGKLSRTGKYTRKSEFTSGQQMDFSISVDLANTSLYSFLIPVYALALFLPTIITELGFTAAQAQLLTVPPYIIAMPLTMYTSIISDRKALRGPFLLFRTAVGIAGFAILLSTAHPWVAYVGSVIGAIGAVSPVPASLAWVGNNCAGDLKRGEYIAVP